MDSSANRILLGNEPRAYREALGAALRQHRPEAEVVLVEPAALDTEIAERPPRVVVCSALTSAVATRVPAWVLLYPDGARLVVTCLGGERTTAGDLDLNDLLALVDRAQQPALG